MCALVFSFIIIRMSVHPNHIANGSQFFCNHICLSAILSIHITNNKLERRFDDYFCYVFSTLTISLDYVEYLILNTLNIEYWYFILFWSSYVLICDLYLQTSGEEGVSRVRVTSRRSSQKVERVAGLVTRSHIETLKVSGC